MDPKYLTSQWMTLLGRLSLMNGGFGPCISSREGKLFRRRFRIPYQVFLFLANKCVEQKLFGPRSCDEFDQCGRRICPIELKLLGVLRILGRNWCFDDVAEATKTQDEINNVFFTCCILHNMLNEYDGYDKQWETYVDWERLHPQPSTSDDNYDDNGNAIDSTLELSTRTRILESRSTLRSFEEEEELGNNIEEEIDFTFDSKRRALINHFHIAYGKGEVHWPKGMSESTRQLFTYCCEECLCFGIYF